MSRQEHVTDLTSVRPAECRRLWYGVSATALFLAVAIILGLLRPGYDAWHQSISALSLGPTGWVQELSFLMLGAALLTTVPVWRRILTGAMGARSYPTLTALIGVSLITTGCVPQDPAPGYDPEQLGRALPTAAGLVHLAFAGVSATCTVGAMFVMASRFATTAHWRHWVVPTRIAASVTVLCVAIYGVWSTRAEGFAGTFERLVVIIPGVWGYALVARLTTGIPFIRPGPQEHDDTVRQDSHA